MAEVLDAELGGGLVGQQAEGDVELVGGEPAEHAGGDPFPQAHLDAGVRLVELGEQAGHVDVARRHEWTDPQAPAQGALELVELLAGRRDMPGAAAWVGAHPAVAVAHHDVWPQLVATVRWIADHDTSGLDIRHLDVPGIDTKFVERHRKVLGPLLDQVLPPGRIDPAAASFATRYGFRPRPSYVRLRLLSPVSAFPTAVFLAPSIQLVQSSLTACECLLALACSFRGCC